MADKTQHGPAWWAVDLGGTAQVDHVRLWHRCAPSARVCEVSQPLAPAASPFPSPALPAARCRARWRRAGPAAARGRTASARRRAASVAMGGEVIFTRPCVLYSRFCIQNKQGDENDCTARGQASATPASRTRASSSPTSPCATRAATASATLRWQTTRANYPCS
jgi:hypothetical protein